MTAEPVNLWTDKEHVEGFLERRWSYPWREAGYGALVEWVSPSVRRVLDLGCGDGEVTARVMEVTPSATSLAVDFSDEMLRRAGERFADDERVEVVRHDLDETLPEDWGTFDLVVSAFVIHHLVDDRKQALYREAFDRLDDGGAFLNLEHVDSPTPELHEACLAAVGMTLDEDDPSNKLVAVETQLGWLRDIGFTQVDCHYKWREIALLAAMRS